jgi:hypothetical protein
MRTEAGLTAAQGDAVAVDGGGRRAGESAVGGGCGGRRCLIG